MEATQALHDKQQAKAAAAMKQEKLIQQKYAEAEAERRRLGREKLAVFEKRCMRAFGMPPEC